MDAETLTFLLRGGHVNMPERLERGIWPHPPLAFQHVVQHLAAVLTRSEWFPCAPADAAEGAWVERLAEGRFAVHRRRNHPIVPTMVAECSQRVFASATEAAADYLKWNLGLPGDLDGWRVV